MATHAAAMNVVAERSKATARLRLASAASLASHANKGLLLCLFLSSCSRGGDAVGDVSPAAVHGRREALALALEARAPPRRRRKSPPAREVSPRACFAWNAGRRGGGAREMRAAETRGVVVVVAVEAVER